jgi:hypothetical protein
MVKITDHLTLTAFTQAWPKGVIVPVGPMILSPVANCCSELLDLNGFLAKNTKWWDGYKTRTEFYAAYPLNKRIVRCYACSHVLIKHRRGQCPSPTKSTTS